MTERLYYDDAYTTRFEAQVAEQGKWRGQRAVALARTYFYPESGGQLADRGTLAGAAVVDVQAADDGRVWHVLAEGASVGEGAAPAALDWARRFDHMQQHTGQHVLSAAFERVLGAPTLSSTLGAEKSVIEVQRGEASWQDVARVEAAANQVLWEDRAIVLHWTDEAGAARFELRKPLKAKGRIRIVEIPDWDLSACGGTHTRRTGEVGVVKVVRWDKVRGNLRFEFLCGGRALRDHAWRTEALLEAAKRRTLSERDLIEHLERAAAERDQLQRQLDQLTARALESEARELTGDPPRGVARFDAERARDAVRKLGLACLGAGAPWVALGAGSPQPALFVARAKSAAGDLRQLLPALLERAAGKGGGSADMLQIAPADAAHAEAAWRHAAERLPALVAATA